jgi:hypothetical protein
MLEKTLRENPNSSAMASATGVVGLFQELFRNTPPGRSTSGSARKLTTGRPPDRRQRTTDWAQYTHPPSRLLGLRQTRVDERARKPPIAPMSIVSMCPSTEPMAITPQSPTSASHSEVRCRSYPLAGGDVRCAAADTAASKKDWRAARRANAALCR